MFPTNWKFAMAAALLISLQSFAVDPKDQRAYCAYLTEQAQAQRDFLRTPVAAAGLTQPETGLPTQLVAGASLGLSDFRKAGLTMAVARRNCELYQATTGALQDIQYAIASLEKQALQNRLVLIDDASKSLDTMTEKTMKTMEAQNATRLMLFSLQTTRIKLDSDRADTQAKIAALYVPPLSEKPLKELVAQKQDSEINQQRALDKLSRQNNWDVALSVGVHQQINPVAQNTQPYGAVSVNYNLASRAINKHMDRSVEAYDEWKKVQEGDIVRNMEVLHQQLLDNVVVQETRLKSVQKESGQIEKNLQIVGDPETSAAFDFYNQLTAAHLLLQIESGDASFRIDRLREYLAKNY